MDINIHFRKKGSGQERDGECDVVLFNVQYILILWCALHFKVVNLVIKRFSFMTKERFR